MVIYFGAGDRPNAIKTLVKAGGKRIMISYADPPTESCWKLYREYEIDVIADSGAFSMWKRGLNIEITDYMAWLHKHNIKQYFNLDIVGNQKATLLNQTIMEGVGYHPIPVFHLGEPMELLAEMVEKYPLVGLGGTVGQPYSIKESWFREIFSRFPNGDFHALGVANKRLLGQFPFKSADSVWWIYKFRDKQKKLSPENDRKDEQSARVKYLLSIEKQKPINQISIF